MNGFLNCVLEQNLLPLGVGIILFILTLYLAAKGRIGFITTLIFMGIVLLAAIAIKNKEEIRNYIRELNGGKPAPRSTRQPPAAPANKTAALMDQLEKTYQDLKSEILEQKNKIEQYFYPDEAEKQRQQQEQQRRQQEEMRQRRQQIYRR